MAQIKAKARQGSAVSRETEGNPVDIRALLDGSMVVANWKDALVIEGRAFVINVGALSTPGTGGGQGTVLDLDQPQVMVSVPSGTSIIPKRILVSAQPGAIASDGDETEILIAVDQDAARGVTPGTSTAETIYNLNTLNSRGSNCTALSLFVGDTTDPVLDIELAHAVREIDILTVGGNTSFKPVNVQGFELLYEPDAPPIINGPAMLLVYWGGTVACLAFATVEWYELPSSVVK